jgi:opacity protein-like surface antigen
MKIGVFAACVLVLAGSAFGQTEFQPAKPGPYVSGLAGWTGVGNLRTKNSPETWRTEFDPGYTLLAALGYDFGLVRAEAEGGHQWSGINRQVIGGVGNYFDGHLSAETIMANGYFDFRLQDLPVVPYFTAGAGMGYFEFKTPSMQKHDSTLLWQIGGGVAANLDKHWTLDVRVRYVSSFSDLEFRGGTDMEFFSTSVLAGLRYRF